jgi:hypothetical protein
VKFGFLALFLAAAVAAGSAAAATQVAVKVTLTGMCVSQNVDDHNGVVTSSTLTCQARAACSCQGATRLVYETATVSPGNGASGKEKGTLVATGPHGSVTLSLVGVRATTGPGVAMSKGTWTLGNVSGVARSGLASRGAYTTQTTSLTSVTGTTQTTVRISASIGCWACAPQR